MKDGDTRAFSTVKKGYDPEEVNAYIDELESKLSYLHARTSELEQKLETARRLIKRFSGMENGLRRNIADSKRAAAAMLSDTKARSDALLDKTRESCGEIISDLDCRIADKLNTVDVMKASVAAFKDQLFDLYSSHIELIETLASSAENFTYEPDYSKVADAVEEFEQGGEPEAKMPDFGEYPEESIFSEVNESEQKSRSFVINEGGAADMKDIEDSSFGSFDTGADDANTADTAEDDVSFVLDSVEDEAADVNAVDADVPAPSETAAFTGGDGEIESEEIDGIFDDIDAMVQSEKARYADADAAYDEETASEAAAKEHESFESSSSAADDSDIPFDMTDSAEDENAYGDADAAAEEPETAADDPEPSAVDAPDADLGKKRADEDYFKFLSDFANGEEEN